jgi:hypothetical protein
MWGCCFWTPLSELPDDIVKQLRAGNPPWRMPSTDNQTQPKIDGVEIIEKK